MNVHSVVRLSIHFTYAAALLAAAVAAAIHSPSVILYFLCGFLIKGKMFLFIYLQCIRAMLVVRRISRMYIVQCAL